MFTIHTPTAQAAQTMLLPAYVVSFEWNPSAGVQDARTSGESWTADCRPNYPSAYCLNCQQTEEAWQAYCEEMMEADLIT